MYCTGEASTARVMRCLSFKVRLADPAVDLSLVLISAWREAVRLVLHEVKPVVL